MRVVVFSRDNGRFAWRPWPFKVVFVGLMLAVCALLFLSGYKALLFCVDGMTGVQFLAASRVGELFFDLACFFALLGLAAVALGILFLVRANAESRIRWQVCERLFSSNLGNPLGLSDGDELPSVECRPDGDGRFVVTVSTTSTSAERVASASPFVSAALRGRFENLAVVSVEQDVASRFVRFFLDDVSSDRSISFSSIDEMSPVEPLFLEVQRGTRIDLRFARSMLICGRTRSGKTTAVVGLLIQILLLGPDEHSSTITIVDGKNAELSSVGAASIDEDGSAHSILDAMREFDRVRSIRQDYLRALSEKTGDAVAWFDDIANMKPSYLFIDEFMALRSILPSRAPKEEPHYSVVEFDGLVQRIATMGASAGCYLIISVAQASVGAGGIPTPVLEACGTRILFRPSLNDGVFLWPRDVLETLPVRAYGPGDAWFSSDDGVHTWPSFVSFPRLDFPAYKELGRLLRMYRPGS